MNDTLQRLIKEPVLQFLILGGGLFVAYAAFAPTEEAPRDQITVTAARVESLSENFARTWRRPPTAEELDSLLDDYVAEEVLYREALKLGLDKDDLIVRRRMRQKMELLLTDALSAAPPTEEEVRAQFEADKDKYRTAGRVTFRQIFLGEPGAQSEADWMALSRRLNSDGTVDLASVGAPSLLPPGMENATETTILRVFGAEFTDALATVEQGRWSAPIRSSYGWHLVMIDARLPGGDPSFEDIRDAVARDLAFQREREARVELIERLKQNYDVTVEGAPK